MLTQDRRWLALPPVWLALAVSAAALPTPGAATQAAPQEPPRAAGAAAGQQAPHTADLVRELQDLAARLQREPEARLDAETTARLHQLLQHLQRQSAAPGAAQTEARRRAAEALAGQARGGTTTRRAPAGPLGARGTLAVPAAPGTDTRALLESLKRIRSSQSEEERRAQLDALIKRLETQPHGAAGAATGRGTGLFVTPEGRLHELRALEHGRALQHLDADTRARIEAQIKELHELLERHAVPAQPGAAPAHPRSTPARPGTRSLRADPLLAPTSPAVVFSGDAPALTPELAHRTSALSSLRAIHRLGVTREEIAAALPILKEIQAAGQALVEESERALEEERRALLAAKPGAEVPAASGERLRQATERAREQQGKGWEALGKAIPAEKATALRQLLRSASIVRIWNPANLAATTRGLLAQTRASGTTSLAFAGGSLTLAELIDLLTQKLEAMRE